MNNQKTIIETDVAIVWGGISGTSLQYAMRHIKEKGGGNKQISSVLIERQPIIGMLNSHHTQNSQTLHEWDIESNYAYDKSARVKESASLLQAYVETQAKRGNTMYKKTGKMLLAVGQKEVDFVTQRHQEFTVEKKLFLNNRLLTREEIAVMEPSLVGGRDPNIPMAAYYSDNGMAIDFGEVAQSFAKRTQEERSEVTKVLTGSEVVSIANVHHRNDLYEIFLNDGTVIWSRAVVVSAGAYTPVLMHKMWYGQDIGILSIAWHYYGIKPSSRHKIRNKIYAVHTDKSLPFAEKHLDPEVDNPDVVRLGPTAFGIPFLERKKRTSFFDYMGIINAKHDFQSFRNILRNPAIKKYIIRNFKYLIPIYGKRLFLKDVRKLIPTLQRDDIEELDGYGGTRPQMINRNTHALDFGEARVVPEGQNLIFNITPSPGASTCLGNAKKDIMTLMGMDGLKDQYEFDEAGFEKEFSTKTM